jgi:hypothetical protein
VPAWPGAAMLPVKGSAAAACKIRPFLCYVVAVSELCDCRRGVAEGTWECTHRHTTTQGGCCKEGVSDLT